MRIIFIIALVLVAAFAGAQDSSWLSVEWAFQLGWIPQGNINFYEPDTAEVDINNNFDFVSKIDLTLFNIFKLGGNFDLFFSTADYVRNNQSVFWPTGFTYLVFAGIEPIKGISFIYQHSCSHPVCAYFGSTFAYAQGDVLLDQSFDRIYIELSGKINY